MKAMLLSSMGAALDNIKKVIHIIAMVLALISTLSAEASFNCNGLCYEINDDDSTTVRVIANKISVPQDNGPYITYNYKGLSNKDVVVPSTATYNGISYKVTKIGVRAFEDAHFKSVTIADGIQEIGDSALSYCGNFYNFERLGPSAFDLLSLPSSVKIIGKDAFDGFEVEKLVISSLDWWLSVDCRSVMPISYSLYMGEELVEDLFIPDGVESIRDYCFAGCKSIKSVHLPNSVRTLGESVFKDCVNLTSVNLSDNIKAVNQYCFGNCSALESIKLPCAIERIERYAFSGCESLTSVALPDSLRYLSGFDKCTKLERIDIPERVDTIGDYAFNYSTNLKTIVSYIKNGESTVFSNQYPFNRFHPDCYLTCTVYVPHGCRASYISTKSPWHSFSKIVALPRLDINGDLKADVADITLLINAILNGIAYEPKYDINKDGEIDIRDVTLGIHDVLNDVAVVPK